MDYATWFGFGNQLAMLGWLVLIVALFWSKIQKWAYIGFIPLLLSLFYLYMIAVHFDFSGGDFGSLEGVMSLFTIESSVLAGWVHYLAFDLWVGTWEVANSKKHGIHPLLVVPCLILTFMFGPVGLVLYILIRTIKTKRFLQNDNFSAA